MNITKLEGDIVTEIKKMEQEFLYTSKKISEDFQKMKDKILAKVAKQAKTTPDKIVNIDTSTANSTGVILVHHTDTTNLPPATVGAIGSTPLAAQPVDASMGHLTEDRVTAPLGTNIPVNPAKGVTTVENNPTGVSIGGNNPAGIGSGGNVTIPSASNTDPLAENSIQGANTVDGATQDSLGESTLVESSGPLVDTVSSSGQDTLVQNSDGSTDTAIDEEKETAPQQSPE